MAFFILDVVMASSLLKRTYQQQIDRQDNYALDTTKGGKEKR
jgi:hypothetical protein